MRIRLPELMALRNVSPTDLVEALGGVASRASVYRLLAADGAASTFRADVLDRLCELFEVPPGRLLERTTAPRGGGRGRQGRGEGVRKPPRPLRK